MQLLRTCDRLARRAVIVADLRRGPLGPLAFWVGARALRFDPVTVADGMTSHPPRVYRRRSCARCSRAAGVAGTVDAPAGLPPGRRLAATAGVMRTVDRIRMRAPVDRVLEAAVRRRAVARAAAPLPLGADARAAGDGGLVEMAAWRPFGPLKYPTWWVSEMWVDRGAPAVHYRHVRGITTGMDVVWQLRAGGRRRPT